MSEPRIYIACLAAYNAGHLHGVWIDAARDMDDIWQDVKDMLAESPIPDAKEYAIHDYEGFDGYQLSEYEGLEQANDIAWFISDYPSLAGDLLNHFCGEVDQARTAIDDQYYGCYKSLADYAQDFTEQTSEIPKHLEFYIDYERMGRDWKMSGDIFTVQTAHDEVHIFSNH